MHISPPPHRPALALLSLVVLAALGPRARADGGVLTDQVVTLTYPAGHFGASPAGDLKGTEALPTTDILYQSGWWYRVEGDTREYPLPAPDTESYSGGDYRADWANLGGKNFQLVLTEHVFDHEGPSGGYWSHLIAINHGATRGLVLFHYLDADATGTAPSDLAQQLTSTYMEQSEAGTGLIRYRAHAVYDYNTSIVRAVSLFPAIRTNLNDSVLDDFFASTGSVGPGDITAAYEFKTVNDLSANQGLDVSVAVYSNMPARYVKGAAPDLAPFPVLFYFDTNGYVSQLMRRTAMVTNARDYPPVHGTPVAQDDFDGDYENDILYRNLSTGAVALDGAPLTGAVAPALSWVVTASGDFNADDKADILWRNTSTQKLMVWFMNGAAFLGSQGPVPDQAAAFNWNATGTGDFNGDGFRDILWYNQTTGKLVVWYMNGSLVRITGGFTDPPSVGNNNWKVVAVGDYGKGPSGALPAVWNATDIVWQNDNSFRIVIWFMDKQGRRTSGTFTSPDMFGIWQTVSGPR